MFEAMFGEKILIASIPIIFSVLAHAFMTDRVIRWGRKSEKNAHHTKVAYKSLRISLVVFLVFIVSVIESGVWALAYLWSGTLLETFEEALYFSLVTFTTLGYGDITLGEEWRLLASFQAVNGLVIFGWSTALVIAVVQWVFRLDRKEE